MVTKPSKKETDEIFSNLVGVYVLESLTVGMYVNAFDSIREYIQNSFDSLNQAVRENLIKETEKKIEIILSEEEKSVTILDYGIGVSSEKAADTLIAIGKSVKSLGIDAGFRGIGRLAGIAYCDKLTFETTAKGSSTLSKVTYNSKKIKNYLQDRSLRNKSTIQSVLMESCQISYDTCLNDEHFFRVKLENLTGKGKDFLKYKLIHDYLASVAPIEFDGQKFHFKSEINKIQKGFVTNESIISIVLKRLGKDDQQIRKPYKTTITKAGKKWDEVEKIFEITDKSQNRYRGWYGETSRLQTIPDKSIAGIRFRINNISVGGSEITKELFEEVAPTHTRFNNCFIGEIHINPEFVTPNSRRDNFADTEEWRKIREDIRETLISKLPKKAHSTSRELNNSIPVIKKRVDEKMHKVVKMLNHGDISIAEKPIILNELKNETKKVVTAKKKENRTDEEIETLNCKEKELNSLCAEVEAFQGYSDVTLENEIDQSEIDILKIVYEVLKEKLQEDLFLEIKNEIENRLPPSLN